MHLINNPDKRNQPTKENAVWFPLIKELHNYQNIPLGRIEWGGTQKGYGLLVIFLEQRGGN